MSASTSRSLDYETDTSNGVSTPLASQLALRLSRGPPSKSLPDLEATIAPSFGIKTDLSQPVSHRPLTQTTSSIPQSRSPADIRAQSHDRSSIGSRGTSPSITLNDSNHEIRQIIVRSFAPRVAVYASTDTEEFVKDKGFKDGLYGLLRPYGELLQGKVITRDSIGSSKAWDDFGIRFVGSQHLYRTSTQHPAGPSFDQEQPRGLANGSQHAPEHAPEHAPKHSKALQSSDPETAIDQVLDREGTSLGPADGFFESEGGSYEPQPQSSQLHKIYLRKILSSAPLVPYETFSHPVACVIAVSSRHPAPIEALRQLYANTGHGSNRTPAWVGKDYLRYYVLVHDEEKDDITKSTALFDLMKRHFGLHCHLLRLRSSQCVKTDDDSTRVPLSEWLSASEEMGQIRARDYTDDIEVSESYIFESDVTAIKAFLREMVTQSIVPFMENRMMTWNDQVASRRRGISGRFMSLSKRWTGFGSTKTAASGSSGGPNSSGNYDHQRGFYLAESPEATMRQLGDYAFMLRDWKLAYSTYDFLRTDFSHDKAWSYHAAANEMAAITSLLTLPTQSSKSRFENIGQMLDTAAYSYLTRCSMPSNVVRCLTLAIELFKTRGLVAVDDAARWGGRLLELGVLTPFAQALATERIADCYASRVDATFPVPSSRRRQTALWNVLASESWIRLDKSAYAERRLRVAKALYGFEDEPTAAIPFRSMQPLWQKLIHALGDTETNAPLTLIDVGISEDLRETSTVEESEQLGQLTPFTHPVSVSDDIDREGFTVQDAGHFGV